FPWIVAGITVAALVGVAFLLSGRHSGQSSAADSAARSYAPHILFRDVHMSQASNFAGSQLTYIDGTVTNQGDKVVTGIVVQALFANDSGEPPQVEHVPFSLIRTREPYVDTQPVSAAPLQPGASRDFRLIFDDVSPLWNQQLPQLEIRSVKTRP
ncbi:MAG: DUF2393 family protein, partial [Acidobacteriaceae bacterium]